MQPRIENWQITKPAIRSKGGIVASQSARAARLGAEVLADGGNAVDAAVTTAFALSVFEPWMSGLGGIGYMLIYSAKEKKVHAIDFAAISPGKLDPAAYPMASGGTDSDFFNWPAVKDGRNLKGPLSIAVPGAVDGLGLAHERFGSKPWAELLQPAIAAAKAGHPVDWWTTLRVAGEAVTIREFPATSAIYLPNGLPPAQGEGAPLRLDMGHLAETISRLAEAGRRDFYEGEIARSIAADMKEMGGFLDRDDLAAYKAHFATPTQHKRGQGTIHLLPGLNAGPTFADTLARLPADLGKGASEADCFAAYARALTAAYQRRMESMGHDGDMAGQGCTTHFCVVDAEGNMVSLTNTLLSVFGSKVVLPKTGVLMNNGVNWFDPRPGRANSIAAGKRPLCNMSPALVTKDGEGWFAIGASGGRRIFPAVFQLSLFLAERGMDLDTAMHAPRINVDGPDRIEAHPDLDAAALAKLEEVAPVTLTEPTIVPTSYATPQVVLREGGVNYGAAHPHSPAAAAITVLPG